MMAYRFCEAKNPVAVLAVVFTFLILTAGHAMALEDSEKEGVLVGGQPYSEVMSDKLHPIAIITRRDIELSGIIKLSDLLSERSKFNDFGSHRPFVLGPGRFAVAVNGRHASSFDIDFNLIPISAVERIEILKGSVSAPHIGKATSGAINIIFREDYEGFEIQSGISRPRAEGGDSERLSVLWGDSLGQGHLSVGAEIFRRNEVRDADRDYSRAIYSPGGSFADTQGVSIGGNTLFLTGTGGEKTVRPLNDCDESVYTGVLTVPQGKTSGSVCGFAYADISWHLQRRESDHVFMNFHYPIGDMTAVHIKGRAARSKTRLLQAPESAGFSFVPTEMLKQDIINSIEGLDNSNFPQEIMVEHSFLGHGNRQWDTDIKDYDLEVGVEGEIGDEIGYHGDIHYNHYSYIDKGHTYIHGPTINAAVNNGNYDIQNPLSEAAEHTMAISESSLRKDVKKDFYHIETNLALHGHLFEILGNELGWETGLQLAYDKQTNTYEYFNRHDYLVDPEGVLGETLNSIEIDRRRLGVFGHISAPLGNAMDLSLAGRYDNSEDLPAIFSHRIASLYRVTPNLALRASWSRGSRSPGLFELYEKKSVSHPFVCDADTVTADCSREQVELSQGANPDLEPDKTESFAAGVSVGWDRFYANAEWFRLRTSDIPSMLDPQLIVSLERRGELGDYPSVKVMRPDGRLARIENLFTNSGESDVDGIDVGVKTDFKTDWADFMLNINWLRIINYERRIAGQVLSGDIPRNRLHVLFRTGRNNLTMQWSTHAVSGFRSNDETKRYRRWIGHDITLNWKKAFGFNWLELTGGMLNIGNEGQSRPDQGEDQVLCLESILGRTLFLTTRFEL
jgi:iron complex outermembrane receptor protein